MERRKSSALEDIQNTYEQRFNCGICMCPKLMMVYGSCQHRICVDCLYCDDVRRPSMEKCPTCLKDEAFPVIRPDIPEDNIESQRCLGIRSCTNAGCTIEIWEWELEEHLVSCPNRIDSPVAPVKRRQSHSDFTSERHYRKILRQRVTRSSSTVSERIQLRPRTQRTLLSWNYKSRTSHIGAYVILWHYTAVQPGRIILEIDMCRELPSSRLIKGLKDLVLLHCRVLKAYCESLIVFFYVEHMLSSE